MSKSGVSRTETVTETNHTVTVELKTSNHGAIRRDDDPSSRENLKGFQPLIILAQVFGLLPIILLIYWTYAYAGGLGLDLNVFNWHPILLSISFIYLTGNGILTFRILRNLPKDTLKLIHASVKGVNCILAIIGVWAAFNFHAKLNINDMYSMHSWIGMLTVVVYVAQAIAGLYAFLYPGIQNSSRATLMPFHRFGGLTLLALSIVSAVSGINEKAIFSIKTYSEKSFEGILFNLCGILFTIFGIIVVYIASNLDYKRYPRFNDNIPNRNK